ncbi:MAG: hypothetical protein RL662_2128 [Bacteroidota bacterium]|jgi:hypothetical protein
MKIKENKYLPTKGFAAINLFGVIFVRYGTKLSERTIRHESIHTRQMKEMLYLPFYLWYGLEWLFRLIQYRNRMTAYYNISFEREAYANDRNVDYLARRKWWAWWGYLSKKR